MARSGSYDKWEDVGLAFTEAEIALFSYQEEAERHLKWMCDELRVMVRREGIPKMAKPQWSLKATKMLINRITWLCVAAGLPSVDLDAVVAMPEPKSKEGKELAALALAWGPSAWLDEASAKTDRTLRYFVTAMRRSGGRWSKPDWSRGNKIANALVGELTSYGKLREMLDSLPPDVD